MRIAPFLLSLIAFPVFGSSVLLMNFEFAVGEERGGTYTSWGTGHYITLPKSEVDARGWNYSNVGNHTILSGSFDSVNKTPFTAVKYKGGNFSVDSSWTNSLAIPLDWPYSGGSGPMRSNGSGGVNYNGNTPFQGDGNDLFPDYTPPAGSGQTFFGRDQNGGYQSYSLFQNDGQWYYQVGDGIAVPVSDTSSLPVWFTDSQGNLQQGFWDSTTGTVTASPSGGSGSGGGSVDVTPIVNAVNTQGQLTREQLVNLLGSSGASWIYDCKLSLSQLYDLAVGQGLITRPQIDLSGIQSSLNTIASKPNVDFSGLARDSTVSAVNTSIGQVNTSVGQVNTTLNTKLSSIETELKKLTDSTVPVIPSTPNFGDSSPDDELPWDVEGFNDSVAQSFGDLVEWGYSGAPVAFKFDIVSGLLTRMIGRIPSVGSDPNMFQIEFELPIIGSVSRQWSFSDFPYIGEFRTFLLWVIYVFFGLACFKLLHATII